MADEHIEQEVIRGIKKLFLILIVVAVVFRTMIYPKLFDPTHLRASNFSLTIPEGWEVYEEPFIEYEEDVEVVVLAPSELINPALYSEFEYFVDEETVQVPTTIIKIYSKWLKLPIWLEGEFPEILNGLRRMGRVIVKKGRVKMGDFDAFWCLTENRNRTNVTLEYYVVGKGNKFVKLEYNSIPREFDKSSF